jgi:NhaP-type Na+/H+ or K+/H+ antiporter
MTTRIAATLALVVFAVCVIAGMSAENGFTTVIVRALLAMLVTLIIGLVLGAMAQRMLDENLASQKTAEKTENGEAAPTGDGR